MSDSFEQTGEKLAAVLSGLVEFRASQAAMLRNLQGVARIALQTELARSESLFGADDSRTLLLKERLEESKLVMEAVAADIELLSTDRAPTKEDAVLIEGRLADSKGRGIGSRTVALIGAKRQRIAGVDAVTSDASGYFAMSVEAAMAKKLAEKMPEGIFVGVLTSKGAVSFATETALPLASAKVDFVSIVLERDDLPLTKVVKGGRSATGGAAARKRATSPAGPSRTKRPS